MTSDKLKSFYSSNNFTLYNGDSAEVLKNLTSESVDLTVTSPPYDDLRKYKGFTFDFETIAKELFRVTKLGGVVVWVVSDATANGSETGTSFKQALYFKEIGFNLYDTMIWLKPSPATPTEGRYYDVFEYMFIFSKGKPKTLNFLNDRKNQSVGMKAKVEWRSNKEERKFQDKVRITKEYGRRFNVWEITRGMNNTKHPAVFPDQLAYDHILSWSNKGDVILDPFIGSGTTAVMSTVAERKCIGIEISAEYCEIIKERYEKETGLFAFI